MSIVADRWVGRMAEVRVHVMRSGGIGGSSEEV